MTRPASVSLLVFDVQGRAVARLIDGAYLHTGTHRARWDASGLPSGTYFYQLIIDGTPLQTRKAILIR